MLYSDLILAVLFLANTSRGNPFDKDKAQNDIKDSNSELCKTLKPNNPIQCFCEGDKNFVIKNASCFYYRKVNESDNDWNNFSVLAELRELKITSGANKLEYIPAKAISYLKKLTKIVVASGNIHVIRSNAFSHLSNLKELSLSYNNIQTLESHAFNDLKSLSTLTMDRNSLLELNREVFKNLPSLEKLFLASNKITTIHNRTFFHLSQLKELDLDRNYIFSLNKETFLGLVNLHTLELGHNSLQVIGDYTFSSLKSLLYLNLANNKIMMLDDNAFYGLKNLKHLSLSSNKLKSLDSKELFKNVPLLKYLNIRGNQLTELKKEVLEPFLNHFWEASMKFDFEENLLPCDCQLNWLLNIKNQTLSNSLKLAIENMKCIPDADLNEKWNKTLSEPLTNGDLFQDTKEQNADYEYYDESQIDGKFFYVDIQDLLQCNFVSTPTVTTISTSGKSISTTEISFSSEPPIIFRRSSDNSFLTEEATGTTTILFEPRSSSTFLETNRLEVFSTTSSGEISLTSPIDNETIMSSDEAYTEKHSHMQKSMIPDREAADVYAENSSNKGTTCGIFLYVLLNLYVYLRST